MHTYGKGPAKPGADEVSVNRRGATSYEPLATATHIDLRQEAPPTRQDGNQVVKSWISYGAMFALDHVVPWGRSFDEYRRMFALREADLQTSILGCADGPAGFNVEATRRGTRVTSCDPLYRFNRGQILERIAATSDQVLDQTRQNVGEFVWTEIRSVDDLRSVRMRAMDAFLEDYDRGLREGRYVLGELPALPFRDRAFELAVCSHFLFLYSDHLDAAFHRAALLELCRVAQEVRIFPLLALGTRPSPHVPGIEEHFTQMGYHVSIERVPYEFQRGANQMMRIRR